MEKLSFEIFMHRKRNWIYNLFHGTKFKPRSHVNFSGIQRSFESPFTRNITCFHTINSIVPVVMACSDFRKIPECIEADYFPSFCKDISQTLKLSILICNAVNQQSLTRTLNSAVRGLEPRKGTILIWSEYYKKAVWWGINSIPGRRLTPIEHS